jgi:dUTP pyrophosphatase
MKLLIKPSDTARELYEKHSTYHEGDAGLDLFFPEDIVIAKGDTKIVNMKISCNMIEKDKKVSYYMYPRSSIAKTPLMLANNVGIIDKGYTGDIKVALRHITNDEDYKISRGDRLVQICSRDLSPFTVELVDELEETTRGSGGFGSTGK